MQANVDYYIELLARGTGKSKEEIAKDFERFRYFHAQDAIDYGIADRIVDSEGPDSANEVINILLI